MSLCHLAVKRDKVEIHMTTRMNLEDILLSAHYVLMETSHQSQKELILYKSIHRKLPRTGKFIKTESGVVFA